MGGGCVFSPFFPFSFFFFSSSFCFLNTHVGEHCPATDMQNDNEASSSIIMAGRALLVKMLITLEPHVIFGSNFVYLCIL